MKWEISRTLITDFGSGSSSTTEVQIVTAIYDIAVGSCILRFKATFSIFYAVRLVYYWMEWYNADGDLYSSQLYWEDTGLFWSDPFGTVSVTVQVDGSAITEQVRATHQLLNPYGTRVIEYDHPELTRTIQVHIDIAAHLGHPAQHWDGALVTKIECCPADWDATHSTYFPLVGLNPPSTCLDQALGPSTLLSHVLKYIDTSTIIGDIISNSLGYSDAQTDADLIADFPIGPWIHLPLDPTHYYPNIYYSMLTVDPDQTYLNSNLWAGYDQYYITSLWCDNGSSSPRTAFSLEHAKTVQVMDFASTTLTPTALGGAVAIRSLSSAPGSRVRILGTSTPGFHTQLGFSSLMDNIGDGVSPAEICGDSLYTTKVLFGHLDLEIDGTWTESVTFPSATYTLAEVITTFNTGLVHGISQASPDFYYVGGKLTVRVARSSPSSTATWSFVETKSWSLYRYLQYEAYATKLSSTVGDTPKFYSYSPGPIKLGVGAEVIVKLNTDPEHLTTTDLGPYLVDMPTLLDFRDFQGGFIYTFEGMYLTRYDPEYVGTETERRDYGYAVASVNFRKQRSPWIPRYVPLNNNLAIEVDGKQVYLDSIDMLGYDDAGIPGEAHCLYNLWSNYWNTWYHGLTATLGTWPDDYIYGQGFIDPQYRVDITTLYAFTMTPRFWNFGALLGGTGGYPYGGGYTFAGFEAENYTGCQYNLLVYDPDTILEVGSGQEIQGWFSEHWRLSHPYPADVPPMSIVVQASGVATGDEITAPVDIASIHEFMTVGSITPDTPDVAHDTFNITARAVDSTDQTAALVGQNLRTLGVETDQNTDQWSSSRFLQQARQGTLALGCINPGWVFRAGTSTKTDINYDRAPISWQREFYEMLLFGWAPVTISLGCISCFEGPEQYIYIVHDSGGLNGNIYNSVGGLQGDVLLLAGMTYPSTFRDETGAQVVVYENSGQIELLYNNVQDWTSLTPISLFNGKKPEAQPYPGGMVIIYHDFSYANYDALYMRWGTGSGSTYQWSDPLLVAAVPEQRASMTVTSDGAVHVVYRTTLTNVVAQRTLDAGVTWTPYSLPFLTGDEVTISLTNERATDLVGAIRIDVNGNLTWTELQWNGSNFIAASDAIRIGTASVGTIADGLQALDGSFYVVYFDSIGTLTVKHSTDQGGTWT